MCDILKAEVLKHVIFKSIFVSIWINGAWYLLFVFGNLELEICALFLQNDRCERKLVGGYYT